MAGPGNRGRELRADARRNRARVLEAAVEAFATGGLSVSIHEIARRAGVGTGTVSRHFPTKEALYEAIVLSRVEQLVARAHELAASQDPGSAFFDFFVFMVAQGAANRGLSEALQGAGYDIEAAADRTGHDVTGTLRGLLTRAQAAGVVREDVDAGDVKALIIGCIARERQGGGPADRERMVAIAARGLRAG